MIYYIIKNLVDGAKIPGVGMFDYISFRAILAVIFSLLIALIIGSYIINFLRKKLIGESVRNLGLEGQLQKKGTPTMGGIIILISIIVPTLLFADLSNYYVIIMLISTVWLGLIGFADDYIKVFKKNKDGLKGRFKVLGQIGLGIIVGTAMWYNGGVIENATYRSNNTTKSIADTTAVSLTENTNTIISKPITTIPFVKNHQFDYSNIIPIEGEHKNTIGWIVYVLASILIITAVSNSANLTDGLDGLAAGVSASIVAVLIVFAYLSGNIIYSSYLNIMYIPNSGELVVFGAAFMGALIGFLWYNSYPAQVFMGDTGSLAIGGIIAVFAIMIRKELLLPILCGVFFVESLSVILQVSYFKYTKKRFGEGKRIFLMSPIHHHFQKKNIPETKIVMRFWIIQLLLAAMTFATLKIR